MDINKILNNHNGLILYAEPKVGLEVFPKNKKDFSLKELQEFVKGHIEIVTFDDFIMVINEEGKLQNLPLNFVATLLYQSYYGDTDYIVGDCLICKNALVK